jgi:hypothetical protein
MNILGGFAPATPGFSAFLPPLFQPRRRTRPASAGSGPGIGARVVSLRCPILRPVSFSLRQLLPWRSKKLLHDCLPVG